MQRMLVARESEVEAIDEVLAAGGSGLAALILEGPAGIGKTAVWQVVFERAAALGRVVLSCRPVEAESNLAFASLSDLLDPAVDEALPDLAEPQRLALEVALLRAAPRGAPPDGRSVGTATRALRRPTLTASSARRAATGRLLHGRSLVRSQPDGHEKAALLRVSSGVELLHEFGGVVIVGPRYVFH